MLELAHTALTTGQAPFIEYARGRGSLYIHQPYRLYSQENHRTWARLFGRIRSKWDCFANPQFLKGIELLRLPEDRVPDLAEVNRQLSPLTGFRARPVAGYVPAFLFFDSLRRREFPTTITIRDGDRLDYLPEPDVFHDVAGHVPMHTDPRFAACLVRIGECAHAAAERTAGITDRERRIETLSSILRAFARFFWFTVEFGLMRHGDELRVYGSGLLSSYGEIEHAIVSDNVQRYPLQLEWVINQSFEIHHYQPLLFIVDSFDHLYDLVAQLERWMESGRLDHVAPGEPFVSEADLASFLNYTPPPAN